MARIGTGCAECPNCLQSLDVAVHRPQCIGRDNLRLLACTQRCSGMKARSAATPIPHPSKSASRAAALASPNASTFSEIIRITSSAEPKSPDAKSSSLCEITFCASHVNRTASTQLAQKLINLISDRYITEWRHGVGDATEMMA